MTKSTCPLNAHSSLSLYPIVRQDGMVQAQLFALSVKLEWWTMKWSESDLRIHTRTGPSKFILSDCRYTAITWKDLLMTLSWLFFSTWYRIIKRESLKFACVWGLVWECVCRFCVYDKILEEICWFKYDDNWRVCTCVTCWIHLA